MYVPVRARCGTRHDSGERPQPAALEAARRPALSQLAATGRRPGPGSRRRASPGASPRLVTRALMRTDAPRRTAAGPGGRAQREARGAAGWRPRPAAGPAGARWRAGSGPFAAYCRTASLKNPPSSSALSETRALPLIGAGFVTPSRAASQAHVAAVERVAEEEADDAGVAVARELGVRRVEQGLHAVVLVVAGRVVHRAHARVAERDLPQDRGPVELARDAADVALVAAEVRARPTSRRGRRRRRARGSRRRDRRTRSAARRSGAPRLR